MTAIQQPRVGGERLGIAFWSPDQINTGAENRSRPRCRSRTFIEKDVAATAGIAKLREFRTFLGLLAARSGQLLNASEIGQQAGIKGSTVQEWISLLAENGVVAFVQPYAGNLNKRLVRTPKVFFVDVGVVTRLQGWRSLEPLLVSPQMGPLFETAVFAELVRCRDHRLLGIEIFLWRTRDGEKLDFLVRLETCHRGPLWIAIEAKLGGHAALGAAIPPGRDFSNSGATVVGECRPTVDGIINDDSWSPPHGPVALSSTQRSRLDRCRCKACDRHDSRGAGGGFRRPGTNHGGDPRPPFARGAPAPSGGISPPRSPTDSLVEKPSPLSLAT